jgi:hypothetical protein
MEDRRGKMEERDSGKSLKAGIESARPFSYPSILPKFHLSHLSFRPFAPRSALCAQRLYFADFSPSGRWILASAMLSGKTISRVPVLDH